MGPLILGPPGSGTLGLEPQGDRARRGESPTCAEATPCPKVGGPTPGTPGEGGPLHTKKIKRRKLRKKATKDKDHEWELARQDAWLREMLTDSSGSESEERYADWNPATSNNDLKRGVFRTREAGFLRS